MEVNDELIVKKDLKKNIESKDEHEENIEELKLKENNSPT